MIYRNFTPHRINLSDGRVFESVGIARASASYTEFDADLVSEVAFGEIEGLPAPEQGTLYIVSGLLLDAAKKQGRTDCIAPATGHPGTQRNEQGHIVSVPGFIR